MLVRILYMPSMYCILQTSQKTKPTTTLCISTHFFSLLDMRTDHGVEMNRRSTRMSNENIVEQLEIEVLCLGIHQWFVDGCPCMLLKPLNIIFSETEFFAAYSICVQCVNSVHLYTVYINSCLTVVFVLFFTVCVNNVYYLYSVFKYRMFTFSRIYFL